MSFFGQNKNDATTRIPGKDQTHQSPQGFYGAIWDRPRNGPKTARNNLDKRHQAHDFGHPFFLPPMPCSVQKPVSYLLVG